MRGSITVSRLTVAYDRRSAIKDIDGCFEAGTLTAVVGPNGAGKSTLIKSLVGILKPASGRIARDGVTARDLAYLPQAAEVDRSFPITVADTVMLGAWATTGALRGADHRVALSTAQALSAVGLDGFGGRGIGSLSAGQFQRVLFARLLLQDAPVIVLDEPFTAIDARTTRDLLDLVRRWHGERRTVIAVLHDFDPGAGALPPCTAAGAPADRLGSHGPGAEPRQPAQGPGPGGALGRRSIRRLISGNGGMSLYDFLLAPFVDYGFMRRALVACLALGMGSGPVGVLLMLRRMSLVGDAMSHAILPGAAVGFLFAGLSLPAMGLGGLVAGLAVALLSGFVSRTTVLREDASFASFYLASLASGVLLVSLRGSNIDLLHVLFGTILAIDATALYVIAAIASGTALILAVVYRPLVVECFDPGFLRAVGGRGPLYHALFLLLVVSNLVAGFQALGTLMAVGLMMLPAAVARLWATTLPAMLAVSAGVASLSGLIGLVASFHLNLASGPAIILTASFFYFASILFGRGGLVRKFTPRLRGAGNHQGA